MSGTPKYEYVRPLNSGGRGDVHLYCLRATNTLVAIKFLRDSHLENERRAFFREIDTLSKRVHGVVKLIESNKLADRPYYVMEYLGGGTLTQYAGRIPDQQLLSLATGLANVLATFHSRCGAHGDYKPDNIFAAQDGKLKLGDPAGNGYGFSVLLAPARGGTPGYWAPEIQTNGTVSRQADVFSFGATLYHLVTGQRPKDGQDLDPLANGFMCSPRLREVILLCTRTDPKTRPTMQQVVRVLSGESWASICAEAEAQLERQKGFVGVALVVGFLFAIPYLFQE